MEAARRGGTVEQVAEAPGPGLPRLAPPEAVARRLAREDEAYIRANYVPLSEVAAAHSTELHEVRRLMAERHLPQPAYLLDDGTEMVTVDHLGLLEEAGAVEGLESLFKARYRAAVEDLGHSAGDAEVHTAWKDYLIGGYGVCLWKVTPENIARKDRLVESLDDLLSHPRVDDPAWRARVRTEIAELDRLERPGAPLDDARWGRRSSRSRLIEDPRQRYPWVLRRW
jgi:hypothetical protein